MEGNATPALAATTVWVTLRHARLWLRAATFHGRALPYLVPASPHARCAPPMWRACGKGNELELTAIPPFVERRVVLARYKDYVSTVVSKDDPITKGLASWVVTDELCKPGQPRPRPASPGLACLVPARRAQQGSTWSVEPRACASDTWGLARGEQPQPRDARGGFWTCL